MTSNLHLAVLQTFIAGLAFAGQTEDAGATPTRLAGLGERTVLRAGDTLGLKGASYAVRYDGMHANGPCATPTNCGATFAMEARFAVLDCDGKTTDECGFRVRHVANERDNAIVVVIEKREPLPPPGTLARCLRLEGGTRRMTCMLDVANRPETVTTAPCDAMPKEPMFEKGRAACLEFVARNAANAEVRTTCLPLEQPRARNACLIAAVPRTRTFRTCEDFIETGAPFIRGKPTTRAGCVTFVIDTVRGAIPSDAQCKRSPDATSRAFCLAMIAVSVEDCDALDEGVPEARRLCSARVGDTHRQPMDPHGLLRGFADAPDAGRRQ